MAATWAAESESVVAAKLSAMRVGVTDFGITATPLLTAHASATAAGLAPVSAATCRSTGSLSSVGSPSAWYLAGRMAEPSDE
eukprot:2183441-Pleurochrysis_carterae.AAC.3